VKSVDYSGHEVPIGEAKMSVVDLWQGLEGNGKVTLPLINSKGKGTILLKKTDSLKFKLAARLAAIIENKIYCHLVGLSNPGDFFCSVFSNLAKADTWGGKSE